MKKYIAMLMIIFLLPFAVAEVGVANPWTDTTREGMMEGIGLTLGVPEGATDVEWRMMTDRQMGEVDFTWDGMAYTARVMPAEAFEDISGLYYEWDQEDACAVGRCEGVARRAHAEGETVDVCLWYDALTGLMYSVSAAAPDLDGFDIRAAAEQVYVPMQTE